MFKKYKFKTASYKNALPVVLFSLMMVGPTHATSYSVHAGLQYDSNGKWPKVERKSLQGSFATSFKTFNVKDVNLEKQLVSWFELSDRNSFIKINESVDANKISHAKYQQYYNNIPLSGKVIMVHTKNGSVLSINGQVSSDFKLNTTPSITAQEAVDIAKVSFGVQTMGALYEPTLVVYQKNQQDTSEVVLAYEFRFDSFEPFFMRTVWVDAQSGEVINHVSVIAHADVQATGQTYYYGNQTISVEQFTDGYRLRDNTRNIETYDASNVTIGVDYSQSRPELVFNNKLDIVSTTTNFAMNPAIDAHWGMEKTYDYFKDGFGLLSYDGKNSLITSYYDPGANFKNMFGLNGTFPNNAVAMPAPFNFMAFGTGDGRNYDPVVGIDVAGHEFTHLVMDNNGTRGLKYEGESGALNESFADIFGTSIEYAALGADSNWLVGEGIVLGGANNFMRSMQDPKLTRFPNTYQGQYWVNPANIGYDNGGVHINSSVQNYWFYLLVEGGVGTNDLGNDYHVSSIGRAKAEQIAYSNMMNYLGYEAGFLDAYEGSLQATEDLFGAESQEYNQVKNAWYAVGIGEGGTLSMTDFEIKSKLKVYPNPVKDGSVYVSINHSNPIQVELYNLLGRRVHSEVLSSGENQIQVDQLSNGVYMMVFDIDGQSHTEKVIINK